MFNYHLSRAEKRAMLKLVGYLAASDEDISLAERAFVRELAEELEISADDGVFEQLDAQNLANLCAAFTRESARRIVLVELINLALSDDIYFTEESATIEAIARLMGIESQVLEAIDDWVRRGDQWQAEGLDLLGLNEDPDA